MSRLFVGSSGMTTSWRVRRRPTTVVRGGLLTGQRPDAPGELDPLEPGGCEVVETPVTDGIEVGRVGGPVFDPVQGIEDAVDAEEGSDRGVGDQSEALRQVDRKSTRLNSSHSGESRMPSSA